MPDVTAETATSNYKKALEKGILKILSKMGISLLSCYHGAQVRVHFWCGCRLGCKLPEVLGGPCKGWVDVF